MKIYEEKEHKVTESVLVKRACDQCEKEIPVGNYYYAVVRQHNDWGYDSVDSIEQKDICSDECLKNEFDDYLKAEEDTKQIEITKKEIILRNKDIKTEDYSSVFIFFLLNLYSIIYY